MNENRKVLDKQGLEHLVDKIQETFASQKWFFRGTEAEWDALSDEEKANILFAAIEEGFELTPEEESELLSSLGVEGEIEVDMTVDEALDAALDIAGEID